MNTILALLLIIINDSIFIDTNYLIAYYIISHYDVIQNISIRDIATACHTSTNTIKKFINTLGYDSFLDFKRMIAISMNIRKNQQEERFHQLSEQKLLQEIQHFNPTINIIAFEQQIDRIVKMIYTAPKVIIIGAAYPNSLSLNFQEDMICMNKLVFVQQHIHSKKLNFNNIHSDDFVIIISIFGTIFNIYTQHYEKLLSIKNKIVITQLKDNIDQYNFTEKIILSQTPDNELYNITLYLFYSLLKTKYYHYINSISSK